MFRLSARAGESIVFASHKCVTEKIISPVLFSTNRSFKRQNNISLKTEIFSKVSVMRHLH